MRADPPAHKADHEGSLLVIDDDAAIRAELHAYLSSCGFRVNAVASCAEALSALAAEDFDVFLLDLWLGSENGFDVLRHLRRFKSTPCIMVTAQDEVTEKIVSLELGADDYLTKPVNLRELLARIRALIRRSGLRGGAPFAAEIEGRSREATWKFDATRRSLCAPDGSRVPLTTAECDLLIELVAKEGLPQSREELCRHVFNREWSPFDRSLDSIIVNLRRKIEPNPNDPLVIKTVRGRGYVFTGFMR